MRTQRRTNKDYSLPAVRSQSRRMYAPRLASVPKLRRQQGTGTFPFGEAKARTCFYVMSATAWQSLVA